MPWVDKIKIKIIKDQNQKDILSVFISLLQCTIWLPSRTCSRHVSKLVIIETKIRLSASNSLNKEDSSKIDLLLENYISTSVMVKV